MGKTLTELKTLIKQFKAVGLDYKHYYARILINNVKYWHFVNPDKCKESFKTPGNYLKFMMLKRLCKQGYKLFPFPIKHENWTEWEYDLRLV